ncbi:PREDICTED: nascent polypeptide-associated complex subunit alpha, muscle-specific form-like [Rhinopithecus bieti]|uniref:nascent polypeptide-associated complex subunit alpha, muscle-specific form-like n=1 Tax=Rhinopithecus bieti TaxID=61621 RepID=UPI00083C212D|nr:PREDICTED: nascent polypeptide-associated complex subunit alpha, muscle-specific form-like [Rhinopithecus bieti]
METPSALSTAWQPPLMGGVAFPAPPMGRSCFSCISATPHPSREVSRLPAKLSLSRPRFQPGTPEEQRDEPPAARRATSPRLMAVAPPSLEGIAWGESGAVGSSLVPSSTAPSVFPPPPAAAAAAAAVSSGNLRLHPGQAPRVVLSREGGSTPRRGVCRVGATSWDQLVALENLPHTHTHTPLLCCRLPLQERRQREHACASRRSTRGEHRGPRPGTTSRSALQGKQAN